MSVDFEIGRMIKFYRKENKLTIQELADKIHKSKSAISKYENGYVSIDINTLIQISNALNIQLYQLLKPVANYTSVKKTYQDTKFFPGKSKLHLYFYDGRVKKIRHGTIEIFREKEGKYTAILSMITGNKEKLDGIEFFYYGTMNSYDTFTTFSFEQDNGIGSINIFVYNPFSKSSVVTGILAGIIKNPISPGVIKVLISEEEITCDENILISQLTLNQSELQLLNKKNILSIENRF